jgi:hypothetical protein
VWAACRRRKLPKALVVLKVVLLMLVVVVMLVLVVVLLVLVAGVVVAVARSVGAAAMPGAAFALASAGTVAVAIAIAIAVFRVLHDLGACRREPASAGSADLCAVPPRVVLPGIDSLCVLHVDNFVLGNGQAGLGGVEVGLPACDDEHRREVGRASSSPAVQRHAAVPSGDPPRPPSARPSSAQLSASAEAAPKQAVLRGVARRTRHAMML